MMNDAKLRIAGLSAGLYALLGATPALAQETAEANAEAEGRVGMGLPGATAQTTAAARAPGGSDHDMMAGRLAIGYLGRSSVPVGAPGAAAPVLAPVIGVRYWLDRTMGLDLGAGIGYESSSVDVDGTSTDGPTRWGFVLHGGVPFALASSRHFTFELIPEANLGFGSHSVDAADSSGFLLDLGARAGAEIHFGFMGLPELSLQASIGALFALQSASTTATVGGVDVETSQSAFSFRTTVYDSPWSIFSSNVAAFYYF